MGLSNLNSGLADGKVFGDLDLSLFDLSWDGEGVEEGDLGWVHSGGTWWDDIIICFIITSMGAMDPTLAAVSTLLASIKGLNSKTGSSENTNPTLPPTKFLKASRSLMAAPNLFKSS